MKPVDTPGSDPAVFFMDNILAFVQLLRASGLPISTTQVIDFVRALELIDIRQRSHVYHAARALLVTRQEHLRLFDTLFNAFWNNQTETASATARKAPRAPRHARQHQPALIAYMARKAQPADPEIDVADKSETF